MRANRTSQVLDEDGNTLPSVAMAKARLAAGDRAASLPWLTKDGVTAMAEAVEGGVPELNGPANADELTNDA
jgi:uncharacterized membrane protein